MAKVIGSEMRGHHFGLPGDIVIFYGVLPFGWGPSHCRLVRFSDALTKLHQLSGPADPPWNLPFASRTIMFIDDGSFIELCIGDRGETVDRGMGRAGERNAIPRRNE